MRNYITLILAFVTLIPFGMGFRRHLLTNDNAVDLVFREAELGGKGVIASIRPYRLRKDLRIVVSIANNTKADVLVPELDSVRVNVTLEPSDEASARGSEPFRKLAYRDDLIRLPSGHRIEREFELPGYYVGKKPYKTLFIRVQEYVANSEDIELYSARADVPR